jgi:hypothetical protein
VSGGAKSSVEIASTSIVFDALVSKRRWSYKVLHVSRFNAMSAPSPSHGERRHEDPALDLFSTRFWFDHLLETGLPQSTIAHVLPIGESGVKLHLMQDSEQAGLTSLSNYYSGLYAPTDMGDRLSAQEWLVAAEAIRCLPGSGELKLQPLAADAPWSVDLEVALRSIGYRTDRYFCFGNWYQTVPEEGFASYWAQRPSVLRNSVERGRRRLSKSGVWRIDIHSEQTLTLETAIGAYEQVYNHSWKEPEPHPNFIPGLIRMAAGQGWLRLGVLWVEREPIAAQLWLVAGGKANIFKLAYVQGHEKLSAGSVLTAALMEHVMDVDRVAEVDYLSGDDAYKADWMASRRERIGLVAFDIRRARGLAAAIRHFGGHWRRVLQRQWCRVFGD